MVTPAQSGRKHARVDWKGRYIKFRNEAQTVENESVIFLILVIVTTWAFSHVRFVTFLTGSYVSPPFPGWADTCLHMVKPHMFESDQCVQ